MADPASLQNLHDIVVPDPIPLLPPAPGWYALGLSVLVLLIWFCVNRYLSWGRNRYRREALAALDRFEKELADTTQYRKILPQLPQLVKRTALAAYGRARVASLVGSDWLAFLDNTGSTDVFGKGNGSLLLQCSYEPATSLETVSKGHINELCKVIRQWINQHQVEVIFLREK
jgi:hypothetical protein